MPMLGKPMSAKATREITRSRNVLPKPATPEPLAGTGGSGRRTRRKKTTPR